MDDEQATRAGSLAHAPAIQPRRCGRRSNRAARSGTYHSGLPAKPRGARTCPDVDAVLGPQEDHWVDLPDVPFL